MSSRRGDAGSVEAGEADGDESVRVWMVERTYSADSPNILVITYATPGGGRSLRKEWAFNRHGAGDAPTVTAALDADPARLDRVDDATTRERYAGEAQRMAQRHAPDDPV